MGVAERERGLPARFPERCLSSADGVQVFRENHDSFQEIQVLLNSVSFLNTADLLIYVSDTINDSSNARGMGLSQLRRVFEHREPPMRNITQFGSPTPESFWSADPTRCRK